MNTSTSRNGSAVSGGWIPEFQERKQPVKFDFAHGVCLVGILTNLERIMVRDRQTNQRKPVNYYTVQPAEGKDGQLVIEGDPVFFLGAVQIDKVLRPSDVGHLVSITCKGEDKDAGRNGNPMKLFQIFVDKNPAPGWAHDGTPISDADLPDEAFIA